MQTALPEWLSDDLWAKIFVEVGVGVEGSVRPEREHPSNRPDAQKDLFQLRLVCRKFNDVFKRHTRLFRDLVLPQKLTEWSIHSLLAWLEQHGASVENLIAYCGSPCLETALAHLMPPNTSLRHLVLSHCCFDASVYILSGLNFLTCCEIIAPREVITDLTSIKELANLQRLHLSSGVFQTAGLPAHLTSLTLDSAEINNTLGFSASVTSLRKLELVNGYLYGLHPHGVAACSAIEEMILIRCIIAGDMPEMLLDFTEQYEAASCMPAGMSALTSLTSLALTIAKPAFQNPDMVDLEALASLPLLQDLFVRSEAPNVSLFLSSDSSALQKLTCLHFDAPAWSSRQHEVNDLSLRPMLFLNVVWSGKHALQCLTLRNWRFTFTDNIGQLTALRSLSTVTFDGSRPAEEMGPAFDLSSFQCFCLMIYRLGRCPLVKLSIDEEMCV